MRGGTVDGTALGARISFGGVWVWLAMGLTGALAAPIMFIGFEDDGWGARLGVFGASFAGFSLRRFFFSGVSSLSLPRLLQYRRSRGLDRDRHRPSRR